MKLFSRYSSQFFLSFSGETISFENLQNRKFRELSNYQFRRKVFAAHCQCEAIDPRLIMHVYFRFTRDAYCITRDLHMSVRRSDPEVIMARICVTRNTTANTGERQMEKG